MKVFVDPGHGMGNRQRGVYDPGACSAGYEEAKIALDYGMTLCTVLMARGVNAVISRPDQKTDCPVWERARMAQEAGCDILVSLHLNAADDPRANGIEIEYRDNEDRSLADWILPELLKLTDRKDHGNDHRPDLAVLNFRGPAILIELGFITNESDRRYLLQAENKWDVCRVIASGLQSWWRDRRAKALKGE